MASHIVLISGASIVGCLIILSFGMLHDLLFIITIYNYRLYINVINEKTKRYDAQLFLKYITYLSYNKNHAFIIVKNISKNS